MPQQSVSIDGLYAADIRGKVELLIENLVNIKDETGKFLLRLPDGRVIDTKGWNDWEWTHGIGMYRPSHQAAINHMAHMRFHQVYMAYGSIIP